MAETEYSQENIAYIRTHVDRIERMLRFEIAANPNSRKELRARLEARPGMPEVYLALEAGPKTQQELAAMLSYSQATVSRVCKELFDSGVIDKFPVHGKGATMAYKWTDFEQLLGVSKIAREMVKAGANTPTKQEGNPRGRSRTHPRPKASDGSK